MKSEKSILLIMVDGGHIGFGHSEVRTMVPGKHLRDFSCLGTHKLSSSEKLRYHQNVNGNIARSRITVGTWKITHIEEHNTADALWITSL